MIGPDDRTEDTIEKTCTLHSFSNPIFVKKDAIKYDQKCTPRLR